jgi:hypothetical protein
MEFPGVNVHGSLLHNYHSANPLTNHNHTLLGNGNTSIFRT